MTRYFYFAHSNKELPITKHYQLNMKVWILEPSTHTPISIKFIDTKEASLLFIDEQSCIDYYSN